ncbi:MAG: tail fiber domain-containing protein [bacterium]|jgi:hypothetical protein|nr:tail fiber domain-containing protein [bacterium]
MKMNLISKLGWVIMILFAAQLMGQADVPLLINYRGYVADKPGTQNFQIQFNIYNQASGGFALWTETQPVDLFDGNFAVQLGSVTPLPIDLFVGDALFIGIQIVGEAELVPRQQIVSVPYAFQAQLLDGLDSSRFLQSNSSAWIKGLGISQTTQSGSLNNLLDIRVSQNDSNRSGLSIQGTPSGGDLGIRITASGTGGERWFIDATNDTSTLGGGLLAFMYFRETTIINPFSESSESSSATQTEAEPNAIVPINPPPIIVEPIPQGTWTSLLALDSDSGRVGVKTTEPNYTLDVRGTIGNQGTLYHSDQRWKENIEPLQGALDKITQLRGVQYDWNRSAFQDMNFPEAKQVGLIAQEVETVVPEVVSEGTDGYKSIDYARLVPLLIESIKTQQQEIQQLRSELEQLKRETP